MADKKRMSRLSSTFCITRGICAAHSMAPSKASVRGRRISICDRCNARCPARAGRRLRPKNGQHHGYAHCKSRRARPAERAPPGRPHVLPGAPHAQIGHCPQHTQGIYVQIRGHLVDKHARILGKMRHAKPPPPAQHRHDRQRDGRFFLCCPGEEGEEQVELHFYRDRPQGRVEGRIEVRFRPEQKGDVRCAATSLTMAPEVT